MSVEERDRIARLFRESAAGKPWHGPSLEAVLAGIDAAAAAARPLEGAHSIWEIVLHLAGWTREVANRLEDKEPRPPALGDWPETRPVDDTRWDAARADLFSAHDELISALARFPASRLKDNVGGERDDPLGTGVSYREMILGALQHDAYHAGQISLLKKHFNVHRT
jgi:uncharacterized damage-inducible protein DinB